MELLIYKIQTTDEYTECLKEIFLLEADFGPLLIFSFNSIEVLYYFSRLVQYSGVVIVTVSSTYSIKN